MYIPATHQIKKRKDRKGGIYIYTSSAPSLFQTVQLWQSTSNVWFPSKGSPQSWWHVCWLSMERSVSVALTKSWSATSGKEQFLLASTEVMKLVMVFCLGSDVAPPHLSPSKCDTLRPRRRRKICYAMTQIRHKCKLSRSLHLYTVSALLSWPWAYLNIVNNNKPSRKPETQTYQSYWNRKFSF